MDESGCRDWLLEMDGERWAGERYLWADGGAAVDAKAAAFVAGTSVNIWAPEKRQLCVRFF